MEHSASLRGGAIAAAVGWTTAIAMTVLTKGADLQVTQTVESKQTLLTIVHTEPRLLLAVMALDTLFVISYLAVYCGLYLCTPISGRFIAALALAFGVLGALSDIVENVLYIVYATGSLHGVSVAPDLPFHYYASTLKWIGAFTSIGLFALVFPHRNWFEWLILAVMATSPLGGALSIAYPQFLPVRAIFIIVGMPLFAILFARRAMGRGPGSAVRV